MSGSTHPLDGDGITPALFQLLARRPHYTMENTSKLDFRIPDTVVYHNTPAAWFYFDAKELTVRRRGPSYLEKYVIKSFFTRPSEAGNDIICTFVDMGTSKRSGNEMVFMDVNETLAFLADGATHTGFLQRFISPKNTNNQVYQAVWSPQLFIVHKRTNRKKILDRLCNRNSKGITYEGCTHYAEEFPCSSKLKVRLLSACKSFVDYFACVDNNSVISRMVVYFKEDPKENLWLLYSSSFRVQEKDLDSRVHRVPMLSLTPDFHGLAYQESKQKKGNRRGTSANTKTKELLAATEDGFIPMTLPPRPHSALLRRQPALAQSTLVSTSRLNQALHSRNPQSLEERTALTAAVREENARLERQLEKLQIQRMRKLKDIQSGLAKLDPKWRKMLPDAVMSMSPTSHEATSMSVPAEVAALKSSQAVVAEPEEDSLLGLPTNKDTIDMNQSWAVTREATAGLRFHSVHSTDTSPDLKHKKQTVVVVTSSIQQFHEPALTSLRLHLDNLFDIVYGVCSAAYTKLKGQPDTVHFSISEELSTLVFPRYESLLRQAGITKFSLEIEAVNDDGSPRRPSFKCAVPPNLDVLRMNPMSLDVIDRKRAATKQTESGYELLKSKFMECKLDGSTLLIARPSQVSKLILQRTFSDIEDELIHEGQCSMEFEITRCKKRIAGEAYESLMKQISLTNVKIDR